MKKYSERHKKLTNNQDNLTKFNLKEFHSTGFSPSELIVLSLSHKTSKLNSYAKCLMMLRKQRNDLIGKINKLHPKSNTRFKIVCFMMFKRSFHSTITPLRRNYYEVLQLNERADKRAIKSNYYKLSKKFHPDLNPNNKVAHQLFLEINEAYAVLGNEANKKKYDFDLNQGSTSKNHFYPAHKGSSSSTHAWSSFRNRRAPRTTGSQSAQEQAERMKWKRAGGSFNYAEHYHRHYEAEEHRRRERMENAARRRRAAAGEESAHHHHHASSTSNKSSDVGHTWGRIWRLGIVLTGIAYATQAII
ncbi:MAG: hypothetical protein EXX96DRAFT_537283 [Benjaminiella poitrasii]|nr:MAG: hypothetical protein EXX96DRAFT_537283 [Benjaminiella poitrasii]